MKTNMYENRLPSFKVSLILVVGSTLLAISFIYANTRGVSTCPGRCSYLYVTNNTNCVGTLHYSTPHGVMDGTPSHIAAGEGQNPPPIKIWGVSDGLGTGVEFNAIFQLVCDNKYAGKITINMDNPYAGDDSSKVTFSEGAENLFSVHLEKHSGNIYTVDASLNNTNY